MYQPLSKRNAKDNDLLSQSLDALAREGAKKLLLHSLELEVQESIERCAPLKDDLEHRLVVRN